MPTLVFRAALGGFLMGLANLVPGISGGTMLLAAGIYPLFVAAIAELSTLRWRARSLTVVGVVVAAAAVGVLLLAGPIKDLVVHRRWIMYSLFVGLTLGGLPVVWRMLRPADRSAYVGVGAGFVGMALLALAQSKGAVAGSGDSSWALLFLAGLAGASAMILPGVSGGYLLLVLGQYVPVLSGVDAIKEAVAARDWAAALSTGVHTLLPVGLGVVVGVVAVSNAIRWCLDRYEKATLGVLVGLLLGAVVGLWPFQRSVEPVVGETWVKGRLLTEQTLAEVEIEDLPTETFPPSAGQAAGAVALIVAGFLVTTAVARVGSGRDVEPESED